MGASAEPTGLGAPEGAEPHPRLGASPAIPSAMKLGPWDGDITDPASRADLAKDIGRAVRGALQVQLAERYSRPKAESRANELYGSVVDAVIDLLWKGYVYE